MIRVYFTEREAADHPANEIEFTAAGGVILRRIELRQSPDPSNLRQMRLEASNPQLLAAYSAASGWTKVENLDLDSEGVTHADSVVGVPLPAVLRASGPQRH